MQATVAGVGDLSTILGPTAYIRGKGRAKETTRLETCVSFSAIKGSFNTSTINRESAHEVVVGWVDPPACPYNATSASKSVRRMLP